MTITERLMEKGKYQGIELGKKEVAINMLAKQQAVSFIAEITGLSEVEINALKEIKDKKNSN